MLCPRCALAVLVLLLVAFTGCDTNNGSRGTLGDLDGTYTLETLRFEPNGSRIDTLFLDAGFDLSATTLEIFGGRDTAFLRYRERGGDRTFVTLRVRALSGQIELEGEEEDDDRLLQALRLPPSFSLRFSSSTASELRGDEPLTLNYEQIDPDAYSGLRSVPGRLRIVFRR